MSLDRWPGQFGTWLMTWVAGFSGAFLRWLWQRIFKGLSALKKLQVFSLELRVGLSELRVGLSELRVRLSELRTYCKELSM